MSASQDLKNDFDSIGFAIAPDMYDKSIIDKIAAIMEAGIEPGYIAILR